MKILFFARLFYPHIGGVEKHVYMLSRQLLKQGHTVTVITEHLEEREMRDSEEFEGIQIYRIHGGKEDKYKKLRIWFALVKYRSLLSEADIVHCHDVFFWYLPFRFLYPRKKVFTTFHGYESYPIAKKALIVRKLSEKLSMGNICVGDFIKKWYGTSPTYVTYGGVSIPMKNTTKKYKKYSALFIGRLDEQTGIVTYLKSFEKLKEVYPTFSFLVIGDGRYRKKIVDNTHMEFLPATLNPQKHFSSYHFAFVSRYLSILEAMVAKRLVIAVFDNRVKEDYLKLSPFAAFCIIEKTPENIMNRIAFIIQHPEEERKMIEQAYTWAKMQSWENVARMYLHLWTKTEKKP